MARFLSIDADSHGLLIAVGSGTRDKLTVERLIAATDLAQSLTTSNAALVGQRLKQLLKEANVSPAPALVTVGRDRIILKEIKHPPVPPADEPSVIRFAAMKEIADGTDDVLFDYVPLGGSLNAGERRAAVAFVKKDIIAAVRTMCDAAGIKIAAITPRPYASVAALAHAASTGEVPAPEPVDGPVAVVVMHEGGGEFTVCRNGQATFTRPISSAAIATEATLLTELRRNLAVASSQANADVQAIYIAEAETRGEGWSGRLRAALGMPVHAFDPLANLAAAASIPAELHGRFVGPVGLLLAKGTGTLPINFAQPRQPRRSGESSPKQKRMLVAAALAFLVLAAAAVGGYLVLDDTQRKITNLRFQITGLDSDIQKAESDAKRLAAMKEYQAREVNWLDEYYDQTERFPDIKGMKLTYLEGMAKPMPTEKERAAEATRRAGKNAPPTPAATLRMTVATNDSLLPEALVSSLQRETKYYIGPKKSGGALVGGNSGGPKLQQFIIDVSVAHRKPEDYSRKLTASFPKQPPPIREEVQPEKAKEPATTPEPMTEEQE